MPLSAPVSISMLLCFGNRHNHITVCDETYFYFTNRIVPASRADWYQSAIFAPCPFGLVQKCLLGASQTLSKLHPVDAGCAFLRNTSIPVQTKKHAKGRRKIDLWRVSFTGSAAGPAAVSHLRRIARYFSVPAKAAASPPWLCGIPGRPPSSA